MPEHTEAVDPLGERVDPLAARVRAAPGVAGLLAEAQRAWVTRARDPEAAAPGWRPFEDAFPTFDQFSNRPR